MTENKPKSYIISKLFAAFLFVAILFLSVFSSMCPKFVPVVEVPLYLSLVALGIFWIFKAKNRLSVLARFLLASTLAVIINMAVSYMVHQRVFPYEMYDERTKQKIEARQQEMLDSFKRSNETPKEKE